jgi:hypothetical protein
MTFVVEVAGAVWPELGTAAEYYADRASNSIAAGFVDAFDAATGSLPYLPSRYRLDGAVGCRRVHLRVFPYLLWCEVVGERVLALALTHEAMAAERVIRPVSRGRGDELRDRHQGNRALTSEPSLGLSGSPRKTLPERSGRRRFRGAS